jgi:alanyl aminopeptidase
MRPRSVVAALLLLLLPPLHRPAGADAPAPAAEEPPALQLPPDVQPVRYGLELEIDPSKEEFRGAVLIEVRLSKARSQIWLHGQGLRVATAQVEVGTSEPEALEARWEQVDANGLARLTLAHPIGPCVARIRLTWEAAFDKRLVGLYRAFEAGEPYAFTMFEPIDARRAFPGFDEPGFKTPFDVSLLVPKELVAVANTPPLAEAPDGQSGGALKRITFATTKPLPTYLLAWAVGPLEVVSPPPLPPNEVRPVPLQVRGVAPRGRGKELGYALQAGGELLVALERWFGIPYPYEKLDHVAVPDFAFGAEENAGEIHYREQILLFEEGKSSEETRRAIASVMAHEMAHQWFGDLVTMRFWDDTWLNESFATWMGQRTVEAWNPAWQAALDLRRSIEGARTTDSLAGARAIRQPLTDLQNVLEQFDNITYQKGAGVLAMFEHYLGAEKFQSGITHYLRGHAWGSGSTDDLLASLSESSGREVGPALHTFLGQAGLPLVEARVDCSKQKHGAQLLLKQSRLLPLGSTGDRQRRWGVPVCARYRVWKEIREGCTLLDQPEGALELDRRPGEPCPAWLIPDAGGRGYYRWALPEEDLARLREAGYHELDAEEKLSLGWSIRAALRTGALHQADGLKALEQLTRDSSGEVAAVPMEALAFARRHLFGPSLRGAAEQYLSALYRPALVKTGLRARADDGPATRHQRQRLLQFLLGEAHDPEVRHELAARGKAWLNPRGAAVDPAAVDPDLADAAVAAAGTEADGPLLDLLLTRLQATQDAELRARLLAGIGAVQRPELVQRALAFALDPALHTNERSPLLWRLADEPARQAAVRDFVEARFDELVALLPANAASHLPRLQRDQCDRPALERLRSFFGPRAPKVPAMGRALAETEEAIRLCIAEVEAQQASAASFLRARQPKLKLPPLR